VRLLVPVTPFPVDDPGPAPRESQHGICHVDDAGLDAGTKVDGLADGLFPDTHGKQALDDVPHVGPVTGLGPITGNRQGFAFHGPVEEVGDDIAVPARHFTGTKGVEKPGVDDREVVEVVEVVGVELAEQLRDLVGGVEPDGNVVLFERHLRIETVDAAPGRRVHEPFHPDHVGILENLEDPHAVDHQVGLGVVDRVLVCKVGSEVEDVGGLLPEDPLEGFVVQDVPLHERDVGGLRDIPFV